MLMADIQLSDDSDAEHPKQSQNLWSVAHVFAVVTQGFFIAGFSMGFTSPVLADLSQNEEGYTSLHKPIYQDLFNVRVAISIGMYYLKYRVINNTWAWHLVS